METTKLKRFATEARVNLMEGVKRKLRLLGFDERGQAVSEPQLVQGATLWKGEEYPEDFYNQWKTLQKRLSEKGLREVAEEAAYTWFNRMMAIRILSMNGFCEPILRIDPSTVLPNLLANARMGRIPEMTIQQKRRFEVLMDDDTKSYEQFALLLTAWCHDNPIINACFGSINDYVELLLPDNILRPDGFLSLLNETDFISEEDYKSAELIGWLYQFYISDRKDEVFAKKGKVEAEEIPAATQIFTPNWIVKYMVQNTILPQVNAPEEIVENAKYLVKVDGADNRKVELEDLKVADFACGSGHILNECFDILFDLYRSEAYSRKEAVEYIFTKNLTGIDIDLRAKQLATFALLLKACQKDESFIDAHCLPHVITVPSLDSVYFTGEEIDANEFIHHFFKGTETKECAEQLNKAIKLVAKADSLGSIIKFNLSPSTRRQLVETVNHWKNNEEQSSSLKKHLEVFDFILTLSEMYDAIVMNPPYLATSKIDILREYALIDYPDSKTDLFSIFMEVCANHLKVYGKYGMINMQSWMFLSTFKELRGKVIDSNQLDSLIQLGPHTFDELTGEVVQTVAFIVTNNPPTYKGTFFRLINGSNCKSKQLMFLNSHIQIYDNKRLKIIYPDINQNEFKKIPGSRFGFWLNDSFIQALNKEPIEEIAPVRRTLQCGDINRFSRSWYEVSKRDIIFSKDITFLKEKSDSKWFPFSNGGFSRKWYGNYDSVILWGNNGKTIKSTGKAIIPNEEYYFDECAAFNRMISSIGVTCRFYSAGTLFGDSTAMIIGSDKNLILVGLMNSKVTNYILQFYNPRSAQTGVIGDIPYLEPENIIPIIQENISFSKQDWDFHETSWDFEVSPLIDAIHDCRGNCGDLDMLDEDEIAEIKSIIDVPTNGGLISDCVKAYKNKWERLFHKLHRNEEELNRQFIEIYGLQDELTPDVPLDEITILQQGEMKIEDGKIKWNDEVIIKQLISYIVGVYMGRYRLDKSGLHIAYPDPSDEDLAPYDFSITQDEKMTIDPDAIIPVLPKDAPFYDNLYNYVVEFIGKVWGQDELTENLNSIEKALGKSLEDYLLKDFWKDHKKMYQNRPIYWEFASKKGAFKAIIYAHRMDKYTIEVLRSKYVLPYIKHIENKISNLESREQELSTKERRELDNIRTKILPELEEYHSRVEQVAAETAARPQVFDLDDGIPHNHSLFGDIVTKLK